ncbi:hypothetical protein RDV89_11840 [Nocardioides zeae]|uniref:Uncharacterized protein n=1 Tax=Nocardioides imazamoxiresistens TaxID=3231893 RepID=A0ABU3PWZ6_9ACTN|nr:hypothetical protein [Nocardioides zeae]MDT9593763.1 hypothetical protein [Nocardioides zeae]
MEIFTNTTATNVAGFGMSYGGHLCIDGGVATTGDLRPRTDIPTGAATFAGAAVKPSAERAFAFARAHAWSPPV